MKLGRPTRSGPADVAQAEAGLGMYPWIAMSVVLIGTYMSILDTTIVNVALPQIGIDLHQSRGIEWIVTAYLLAAGIALPITGWLADRAGRKLIFTTSLGLFAAGSLLSALAPNLPMLVLFRIIQGLAGGALMPVGMAMVFELFPPDRRGTALGIWGVAAMAGPAIGPVLGGLIVTEVSWRWLFIINVPIGVIGVILAIRLLRDIGFREQRRFDALGLALIGTGLICLLLAFSETGTWGWTAPATLAALTAGIVLIAAFAARALHITEPLIELRMFRTRTFTLTMVIMAFLTLMQFGRLVFIPLELETLRHFSALKVGLMLTPGAVGAGITNPFGGRLTDRIGPRVPTIAGILLTGIPGWFLATLSPTSSTSFITLILAIQGFGTGFSMMPNMVAGMNSLPSRFVAQASAVRSLNRQVWGSLGTAILASVVASRIGRVSAAGLHGISVGTIQSAYNAVFAVALGALVVALVLAFFLPGAEGTHRDQEARTREHEELKAAGMLGAREAG